MHALDVFEHFKSLLPYCIFFVFPVLILISPINPIEAAHDFTVYRLQQFDNAGSKMGSRSAMISFEARTLGARSLTRKCLMLRLMEATGAIIRRAIKQNVGGIVILLPQKWSESSREHFLRLETELTSDEYLPGVVFAKDSPELSAIHAEVMQSVQADAGISAAAAGFQAVLSTGYQLEMSELPAPGQTKGSPSTGQGGRAMSEHEVVCLHGKLTGSGVEESLPTVILVAHYDAFGAAPGLAHGADSNGSGVLALLELARLFSRLFSNSRTHARYNLVFLMSGAGKFNYYGTKKWLDDHLDGAETGLLSDVQMIVNLEGLSGGPKLHVHVSKPPKEGSPGALFFTHLQQVAKTFPNREVVMVHKKINLADEALAWEHERFSIRRLPGLTVTHFDHHDSAKRRTMLDKEISVDDVAANTQIIGEALVRVLYNVSTFEESQLVLNQWMSRDLMVSLWKSTLSRYPLAAQMLHRKHPVLMTLQGILEQHLQEVRVNAYKPDKRDPEIMFFGGFIYKMTAHNVKSTIFDFVLCCFIGLYLAALYFGMQHLPTMLNILSSVVMPNGMKKLKPL